MVSILLQRDEDHGGGDEGWGLSKRFGTVRAPADVDRQVRGQGGGRCPGPNSADKTATLRTQVTGPASRGPYP
jgi:hypothetical protein